MNATTIAVPLGQVCPDCGASGDALHDQLRSYRVRGHSIIKHFWGMRCSACDWSGPVRPPTQRKTAPVARGGEVTNKEKDCRPKSAPSPEKRKGFRLIMGGPSPEEYEEEGRRWKQFLAENGLKDEGL